MKQKTDDKKRDEVLKRMLQMPHKPHVPKLAVKKSRKIAAKSPKDSG